jgi:hypothetical protein
MFAEIQASGEQGPEADPEIHNTLFFLKGKKASSP